MKRILCLLICLTFILMSSCGSEKEENEPYEKSEMDIVDIIKYLNVEIYIDDYNIVPCGDNIYDVIAVVHVRTSRRADCYFENASVKLTITIHSSLWNEAPAPSPITLKLDREGEAHSSFVLHRKNRTSSTLNTDPLLRYMVSEVKGYIYTKT